MWINKFAGNLRDTGELEIYGNIVLLTGDIASSGINFKLKTFRAYFLYLVKAIYLYF